MAILAALYELPALALAGLTPLLCLVAILCRRWASERRPTEAHEVPLVDSEAQFRAMFDLANVGIAQTDTARGCLLRVNAKLCEIGGYEEQELLGRPFITLVHPDDRAQVMQAFRHLGKGDNVYALEQRYIRKDSTTVWVRFNATILRDPAGRPMQSFAVVEDITERKQAEAALRSSEERLRLAVETTGLGIWDYDAAADQRQWSKELKAMLGLPADCPADPDIFFSLVHPDDRHETERCLYAARLGEFGDEPSCAMRIRRADDHSERWLEMSGGVYRDADGAVTRIIATVRDVTEQKRSEDRIRWVASHDALTQLPNRTLFQECLTDALDRACRDGEKVGLLLLDLDELKQVNDTHGHDAGDALLRTAAERLRVVVGPGDTVARLGGDEFAVIVPDICDADELRELVDAITARLREPATYQGRVFDCRASIGATIYPDHDVEAADLLKNADIALYVAKSFERGGAVLYEREMRSLMQHRAAVATQVRAALADGRVVPFYQPKVSLVTDRLVGFEALLRVQHPSGRVLGPSTVGSAFEDFELATALSDRMLDQVIADMRRWFDAGIDFGHVAVNASAAEFRRSDFAERLLSRLEAAGIAPSRLELEVTETVFLESGADAVGRALQTLSAHGVKIALDDFGTGYASLSHLKQFPVDIIKIDQSFVRDLEQDPDDAAIVRAVVTLGHTLAMQIVAEGIETPGQAGFLAGEGCDIGQGYLFSVPVAGEQVPTLIAEWDTLGIPARRIALPAIVVN